MRRASTKAAILTMVGEDNDYKSARKAVLDKFHEKVDMATSEFIKSMEVIDTLEYEG